MSPVRLPAEADGSRVVVVKRNGSRRCMAQIKCRGGRRNQG